MRRTPGWDEKSPAIANEYYISVCVYACVSMMRRRRTANLPFPIVQQHRRMETQSLVTQRYFPFENVRPSLGRESEERRRRQSETIGTGDDREGHNEKCSVKTYFWYLAMMCETILSVIPGHTSSAIRMLRSSSSMASRCSDCSLCCCFN